MNKELRKYKGDRYTRNERLTYLVAWILVAFIPFIVQVYSFGNIRFARILVSWVHLLPFFAVFLLNDLILLPTLFRRGRKWIYLMAVVVVFAGIWFCIEPPVPREGVRKIVPRHPVNMFKVTNVIITSCVIFANIAIKMYFVSLRQELKMLEINNKRMQTELESLKYQINPHFLMNTLNNIQALVDIDPAKANTTIQRLSKMMRYVLYENAGHMALLNNEIDFMRNYMALMRIRYPERVEISLECENIPEGVKVPPLLFITYVENAFKHGVSYRCVSYVRVSFGFGEGKVAFRCENTIAEKRDLACRDVSEGGIGLENVKRRLDLIYGREYSLKIQEKEGVFVVELELPKNERTAEDKI